MWNEIKSMVEAAQAELLNPDGSIKNRCKTKVSIFLYIKCHVLYHIFAFYIIYYIIFV